MTAAYSSARQARQVLADRLRELRVEAGLTGQEHARRCGWHAAKTSRIEHNKTAPSAEDVRTWCRACVADDQADDLVALLRAVEGMFIEWRRMQSQGLARAQQALGPLYERTKRFRVYSSWVVPGMLQTPAYAEQVFRTVQQRDVLPDDVDGAVAARLDRQRLLTESGSVFAFLIEEAVLRNGLGGIEVMENN